MTPAACLHVIDHPSLADVHAALACPLVRAHLQSYSGLSFSNLLLSKLSLVLFRDLSTVSSPCESIHLCTGAQS